MRKRREKERKRRVCLIQLFSILNSDCFDDAFLFFKSNLRKWKKNSAEYQMNTSYYEWTDRGASFNKKKKRLQTKTWRVFYLTKNTLTSCGGQHPMKPQEKGKNGAEDRWWVTCKAEKYHNGTWMLEDKAHWPKGEFWRGIHKYWLFTTVFFFILPPNFDVVTGFLTGHWLWHNSALFSPSPSRPSAV